MPARADFDATRALARARSRENRGAGVIAAGVLFIGASVTGLVLLVESGPCFFCAEQLAGGYLAAGGVTLAVPLLASGITLERTAAHDRDALAEHLPPDFFATGAQARRRTGARLAIAGASLTAAALILGGVALWAGYDNKPYNSDLWAALTVLAAALGGVGLGVGSSGLALYAAGREDH